MSNHVEGSRMADRTDQCWRELAAAIVRQAVDEYRAAVRARIRDGRRSRRLSELEGFFRGEWCATLCEPFGVNPARVVREVMDQEVGQVLGDADD
jgi:hypothetical protein